MLTINNLRKTYRKTKAVDDASFSIEEGEVAVLVGSNGAGKSTTIQSIVGILKFSGDIKIDGLDNRDLKAKEMLAYVPEIPSMYPLLNVREHIEFMARAYNKEIDNEKIDALLKRFELDDKQSKLGDELSKGMMQKVSICCALVVEPKVLILDEPMVGLDPKAIKELKLVVNELKAEGKTILISTHMMEMVDSLWDRLILMKDGKILTNLTKKESGSEDLEALFFQLTEDNHQAELEALEGDVHE